MVKSFLIFTFQIPEMKVQFQTQQIFSPLFCLLDAWPAGGAATGNGWKQEHHHHTGRTRWRSRSCWWGYVFTSLCLFSYEKKTCLNLRQDEKKRGGKHQICDGVKTCRPEESGEPPHRLLRPLSSSGSRFLVLLNTQTTGQMIDDIYSDNQPKVQLN